ncbi:MAG TPA: hypothetical protein PL029_03375, partial [Bacteroidia bacterium]|nr:hypothetical protein [Bacteroidia bacterium]
MKTNAKKIILGLGLALLGSFAAKSQGVQNIIVEKYYKADANDVANATSNGAVVPLTTNHVTYRVFVKMAPGYQLNALYGDANHPWKYTTTTAFYNDPQFGAVVGVGTSTTNVRKATAMIDSYLTMGGAANNKQGVLKIYDTDGSIGNFNSILANNPGGVYGAPINGSGAADGLMTGTVQAATAVGFSTETDIFDQTAGGTFSVNAQSIAALGGAVGTTSDNIVFIGQFTTDGIFGFQ